MTCVPTWTVETEAGVSLSEVSRNRPFIPGTARSFVQKKIARRAGGVQSVWVMRSARLRVIAVIVMREFARVRLPARST